MISFCIVLTFFKIELFCLDNSNTGFSQLTKIQVEMGKSILQNVLPVGHFIIYLKHIPYN